MIKAPDVTLLYVMFAFIVSYAVLKRFLFRPLGAILEQREEEERAAARIHAESVHELERAVAEGEARLALARRKALKEREALRAEGIARFESELADARRFASNSVETASGSIQAEAAKAAAELTVRSRALAVELAEKILGRKLAA
ncbi:MAG TPA: ATP synthase F0 subunit B [Thermoanaerobaculia bacterium]|jgi:F-type H+-transporting ATPase subunit b|nr:ATP synthase F0 subunit B [Thermoanaerobaculia bacterium]